MSNSSKNTKSQKPRYWSYLGYLILFLIFGQCSFTQTVTQTGNLATEQKLSLEKETQRVRSYIRENCPKNSVLDSSQENFNIANFCSRMNDKYKRAKQISLVSSQCKSTTRYFTKSSTQCHLDYRLSLDNGESILERFSWEVKGNKYTLLNISWVSSN